MTKQFRLGGKTIICRHQDKFICESIAEAKAIGESLRLTEVARMETGTETIASIDATSEQRDQWAQQYIRLLFWTEGTRCGQCGHIATGPLTRYSAEDVQRWQRRR